MNFIKLLDRLPYFDVGDGKGDTFFRRYDLVKTKFGSIYLHRFFRSDRDRCLHDHPWSFVSIVLRGGYWEEMFYKGKDENGIIPYWRRPGSILWRPAKTAHRISINTNKPLPWSLVFVGRRSRSWGFWTVDGWKKWEPGQPNPVCENNL
jgi:hypothetical protein